LDSSVNRFLLHEVDLAVGRATGASEVVSADLGVFVANPVLTLGAYDNLDGPGAVLPNSVSDVLASLRHDVLLVFRN
jgi:hypothetical protein